MASALKLPVVGDFNNENPQKPSPGSLHPMSAVRFAGRVELNRWIGQSRWMGDSMRDSVVADTACAVCNLRKIRSFGAEWHTLTNR